MWTTSTPIIGPSHGKLSDVIAYAERKGAARISDVRDYITTVFALCHADNMPDAAVVIAQSIHETSQNGIPWNSSWWRNRLNPSGLGITGTTSQDNASKFFKSGNEAARAQVAHLLLYAVGRIDRGGLTPADDPRYDAYVDKNGTKAVATTLAQLTGRWGMDPEYADGVVKHLEAVFADAVVEPTQPPKENPKMYTTVIPGLSKPIVTSFPVIVDIIPTWQTNQRSGIRASKPYYYTQHETGNENWGANAQGERNWLHSGAGGSVSSFHFAVDDTQAVCLLPVGEVAWQAADGAGPGNMNSAATCELCVGGQIISDPVKLKKSRNNAEELAAQITAQLGIPMANVKRHWDWNYADPNRHHCPDHMMNDGYWPTFVNNIAKLQGQSGGVVEDSFEKPDMPLVNGKPWDGVKDFTSSTGVVFHADKRVVTPLWNANTRKWASMTSGFTSAGISANKQTNVLGWVSGEDVDGEARWWITSDGSRMHVGVTKEKPNDQPTKPVDPVDNPNDGSDTSPDPNGPVIVGGGLYYPVETGEIEITTDTDTYHRAATSARKVGKLKKGDKITPKYWCVGDFVGKENYWWILPAKDEAKTISEGVRVPMSATSKRPD